MNASLLHPDVEFRTARPDLWAAALIACAIAAFWNAWLDIFSIATHDPESNHILLVPFLAIWLAVDASKQQDLRRSGSSVWGMLFVMAAVLLHQLGQNHQWQVIWHLSAVLCVIGILAVAYSVERLAGSWPAVVILLALVPIPGAIRQQIARPLQWFCAVCCEQVLNLIGFTVTRHGCLLELNGVQVAVAEACNGMRMVTSFMLLTYAACFAFRMSRSRRLWLLVLSPVFAIVLNLARLLLTVVCYAQLPENSAEAMHDVLGWVFPVLAFLFVFALRDQSPADDREAPLRIAATHRDFMSRIVMLVLLVVLTLSHRALFPDSAQVAEVHETIRQLLDDTPWLIDEYVAQGEADLRDDVQSLLNPLASVRRWYRDPETGHRVMLVAVACSQARDLIGHHPGICLPSQGWQPLAEDPCEWPFEGETIVGRSYSFQRSSRTGYVRTRVTSVLVTSGRFPGGDPQEIDDAASDCRRNLWGAMTIQLQTLDSIDAEQWRVTSEKFIRRFMPALRAYRSASCTADCRVIGKSDGDLSLSEIPSGSLRLLTGNLPSLIGQRRVLQPDSCVHGNN